NLLITGRDEYELSQLKLKLEKKGVLVELLAIDLTQRDAPARVVEAGLAINGKIDILINNAGLGDAATIMDTDEELWDALMNINAKAPFFLCQKAIPVLKKSDAATIVNISSVVGRKGYVNQAAYTASKHALTGFTKVLAQELQSEGIRVHLIAPGGVATEMVTRVRPDLDIGELIQPDEIAEVIVFLLKHRGNAVIDEINIRRSNGIAF
ncbi:MAG TPA: SDR family oxidoreductase, partial [Spirochaetia bacterium]|nr:SDR family oxidoreductase [Spirochaetia bacterium]